MNYLLPEPQDGKRARTPFAPGKKPPPVCERPKCPGCGKPLRPWIEGGWEEFRHWEGHYQGYGDFCSTTCTVFYANALFKKTGVRFIRKDKET
jgi:hypothetical protein